MYSGRKNILYLPKSYFKILKNLIKIVKLNNNITIDVKKILNYIYFYRKQLIEIIKNEKNRKLK